jgi:hypothetical protein
MIATGVILGVLLYLNVGGWIGWTWYGWARERCWSCRNQDAYSICDHAGWVFAGLVWPLLLLPTWLAHRAFVQRIQEVETKKLLEEAGIE